MFTVQYRVTAALPGYRLQYSSTVALPVQYSAYRAYRTVQQLTGTVPMVVLLYPGTVALLVLRAPWYSIVLVQSISFRRSRRPVG